MSIYAVEVEVFTTCVSAIHPVIQIFDASFVAAPPPLTVVAKSNSCEISWVSPEPLSPSTVCRAKNACLFTPELAEVFLTITVCFNPVCLSVTACTFLLKDTQAFLRRLGIRFLRYVVEASFSPVMGNGLFCSCLLFDRDCRFCLNLLTAKRVARAAKAIFPRLAHDRFVFV